MFIKPDNVNQMNIYGARGQKGIGTMEHLTLAT